MLPVFMMSSTMPNEPTTQEQIVATTMNKIDNISQHHTPEGTTLTLMPAGIVPRLGAWLIDLVVRAVLMFAVVIVLMFLGEAGAGLIAIAYFLLEWFYPVFFEIYHDGQTIGKKRLGLRVCQDDGMAIGWRTSMTRNLLRVADFLPFMFVSASVCMLFHGQNKRLGDMVAGTMVVYVSQDKVSFDIPAQTPATPKIPLLFDEQKAVLAFAERLEELPAQRQLELAQILAPISHQTSALKIADEIVGFANTIIGKEQA